MIYDVTELERGAASPADGGIETYIERCRRRIPDFVGANFSLEQTWKLQRPTLWRDLACAPINSAWSLPHLAIHKVAETADKVGYPQLARLAKRLPPGIKTGYQRQIERRIRQDLLEWDPDGSPATPLPASLPLGDMLHKFSSGRAIVSDLAGTLVTLAMSWVLLGSASLSLTNLAHAVARKATHDRKASHFFLGKKAGAAFYNIFPPAVDETTIWATLALLFAALAACGLACTILSDPIRKCLGFHRHRLEALLDEVERELIVLSHKRARQP